MLVYENGLYQVHIIKDDNCTYNYTTVNKLTGIVEDQNIKLPQSLNMADALDGALETFFKEGRGKFNKDIQEGYENGINYPNDENKQTESADSSD